MQSTQLRSPFLRVAQQERGLQTSSFFRSQHQTPQQVGRQSMAETTLTYGPALAKLKSEADKIRRWKTATQFELKKKESQLSETRQQLEVVREEVTRVRVREEALKTQLQDQFSSHTELQHKILVTRGLCSTLKEKVEKMEVALHQGRVDQDHNKDLDSSRLQQYRALAARFAQLEQEQSRVQSSLEEALAKEQENGRSLEVELTNERAESQRLRKEVEKLQTQLQKVLSEFEEEKERLLEVERRLAQEVTGRERSEQICEQLQQQLKVAQEDRLSLQQNILSLNEKISSQQSEYQASEAKLLEEVREGEKRCREMTERIQEQQSTIAQQETQLTVTAREKENLETSLTALREELCAMEYSRRDDVTRLTEEMKEKEQAHSLEISALSSHLLSAQTSLSSLQTQLDESEAVSAARDQEMKTLTQSLAEKEIATAGLVSEVDKLRNKVGELEKEREERMDERKKERVENETTISSLTVELSSLRTQLQQNKKTEGEKVKMLEKEKSDMEGKMGEVKRQLEEVEKEGEKVKLEMERVKRESEEETRRWRDEAESARETQSREKESFDTQVTELCGMLERYRSENQKIVQQKELQIQSLQTSLTTSRENKEEMEEMLRVGQEEVRRLGEEVAQLQTELGEREEDLRMREGQVREKDEEMAELLKAVDTLRKKQQSMSSSIPQSTSHTPRLSSSALPPHTPLIPTMSSMGPPMSAPVRHSLRPPVKKTRRCEEDEDEEEVGVAGYGHTDCEDILFKKPRPPTSRGSHSSFRTSGSQKSAGTPTTTGPPRSSVTPRASRDHCSSSVGEVSSTGQVCRSDKKKHTPSRVVGGRGRKLGGERSRGKSQGGRKPAAGTAWFDLDAVFGLGPED